MRQQQLPPSSLGTLHVTSGVPLALILISIISKRATTQVPCRCCIKFLMRLQWMPMAGEDWKGGVYLGFHLALLRKQHCITEAWMNKHPVKDGATSIHELLLQNVICHGRESHFLLRELLCNPQKRVSIMFSGHSLGILDPRFGQPQPVPIA